MNSNRRNTKPKEKSAPTLSEEQKVHLFLSEYEMLCHKHGVRLIPVLTQKGSTNNGFGILELELRVQHP